MLIKTNSKCIILMVLGVITLLSCKTKKAITTNNNKTAIEIDKKNTDAENLFNNINLNKNNSEAIYYKSETEYKDKQLEINLEMEVQAVHDQYIWMNARALGFLNVARVIFKPDSIRILDLQRKIYISASYQYLKNFTSVPLQFEQLQNMIWGNALFDPNLNNAKADTLNQLLSVLVNLGSVTQKSAYNNQLKAQNVFITEQGKNQDLSVLYSNFLNEGKNSFPQQVIINIQGEKKLDCKFNLSDFATQIKRDPQFVVPKSYKVQVY